MNDKDPRELVHLPNLALFSVLVAMGSWPFTVYSLVMEDPKKSLALLVVDVLASAFLLTLGYRSMRDWQGREIGLSASQAIWVAIVILGEGCFIAWLFN